MMSIGILSLWMAVLRCMLDNKGEYSQLVSNSKMGKILDSLNDMSDNKKNMEGRNLNTNNDLNIENKNNTVIYENNRVNRELIEFNEKNSGKEPFKKETKKETNNRRVAHRSIDLVINKADLYRTSQINTRQKQKASKLASKSLNHHEKIIDSKPHLQDYTKKISKIARTNTNHSNIHRRTSPHIQTHLNKDHQSTTIDNNVDNNRDINSLIKNVKISKPLCDSFDNDHKVKYRFSKVSKAGKFTGPLKIDNSVNQSRSFANYGDHLKLNMAAKMVMENSHKWIQILKKPVNENKRGIE